MGLSEYRRSRATRSITRLLRSVYKEEAEGGARAR